MEQQHLSQTQFVVAKAIRSGRFLQRATIGFIAMIRRLFAIVLKWLRIAWRYYRRALVWAIRRIRWASQPAAKSKVQAVPGLELEVSLFTLWMVVGVLNLFV